MPESRTRNPAPGFAKRPEYRIVCKPAGRRMRVVSGCVTVAESDNVLVMRENDYAPVYYFPRADVNMEVLSASEHKSFCAYKGDASYWSIAGGAENAAWSYEAPFDEMAAIAGMIAFYDNKVKLEMAS